MQNLPLFRSVDLDAALAPIEDADHWRDAKFRAFREKHPDHIALTYINCSTEVKALSDVIVTSSSAETILEQIPNDPEMDLKRSSNGSPTISKWIPNDPKTDLKRS